ncbi:multicopper oxidase family protein [Sulfitobacter sp. KE34]|uniref:multicopper oxidase family protein n=1 Tax=unclassified Sulfitobacter TaxID=196795 RepID=UPI0023E1C335|nr:MULTISPECIES: multicopper oxidase family protein [unclassified Sulfitobacter]MDF3351469.1 multicopper oxidase family protein [Sulfitobacter sp. KE12]MDF3355141.1 multicopper oxidase family protein [Sulfitobacter sp. KE27]MDF3358789.1 multicopper oxidase family protein [Sulfitobacter sp. KE33]MDF3366213.1 multicopper oxidase family protein [Sulfitobacter sp. Ks34]MDF3369822.1 multicopper oxidase family protein [Sulfitobacter sp. Ks43]
MNRRQFLASVSAAAVLPLPGFAGQTPLKLKAETVSQQILPEGEGSTAMLGFNGSMPGPEIRLKRGARASIEVENGLEEGTAVHWHGIRLENRMDGVPVLTQDLINPGDSKTYSFVPPDAGTYWYHSHYISQEQVARGLMGPLIVEDDAPLDLDHDITVILSDWIINEDGSLVDEFTDMHSVAHAGYMGNFARAFLSRDEIQQGDRVRFRLINAATNRIFPLLLSGVSGSVVALDGMPLGQPRALSDLVLAPAQRADLIVDVTGPVRFDMSTRQGTYRLAELAVSGSNTERKPRPMPNLAAPALPAPDEPSQHLTLTMMGGAMGRRHGGANIWSFNDVSDLPEEPFATIPLGETVRITLANETAFPHGIHLHGHHFFELSPDGTPEDLRDTTLVAARESRDVLCVFDNPGRWLIHCHMLSHSIGGMRTWVEVA